MDGVWQIQVPRRRALGGLLAMVGGLGTLGLAGTRPAAAQASPQRLLSVSGGGVNVKQMPSPDGLASVTLRESFSFDAHYAQCIVEDNGAAFEMDTHELGRVVIKPHAFFMAMYSQEMGLVSIRRGPGASRIAKLAGPLGGAPEAGTAAVTLRARARAPPG